MAAAQTAAPESAPLSAIDWLSDSVATAPALPPVTAQPAPSDITENAVPAAVATLPLDQALPDTLGLMPPGAAGLPDDLWGASPAGDLAQRLREEPLQMLPAVQDLLKTVLLAELDPPVDASTDTSLFLARIDRLLELGYLAEADALLMMVPTGEAEIFRRAFDVALLTGAGSLACEHMRATPDISPTYQARIFCLARGGDWQAAALTLETANALGMLTERQDHLLARFLDPELYEGVDPPRPPLRPTPLTFVLYEAIGEPLSTEGLPMAFAHADLRSTSGWRARLHAAERLAATGALDGTALMALYRERKPAASGGVWDRAATVQALDDALATGEREEIAEALMAAWAGMAGVGLEVPFAEVYGERLAAMALPSEAKALAFRIGLLSPEFATIAARHRPVDAEERFLMAVARGLPAFATTTDAAMQAVGDGFAATTLAPRYQNLTDADKPGEALLAAMSRFSEGIYGDYAQVSDALAALRALGQEMPARRASLEFLILDRRG